MDTTEKITTRKKVELIHANKGEKEPQTASPKPFRFNASALSWGLMAGLFMGVYLLFLQMSMADGSVGWTFAKHLFLAGFLGWGLWKYHEIDDSTKFFQRGILLGAMTTFYAALTLVAVAFAVAGIAPDLAFDKFGQAIDSPSDLIVTNTALFLEVLVFGMVLTFIWLQYLKNRPDAKPDKR